ncbi:MAG: hypothetical protein ABIK09_10505 [Pseudomonadota bacterium]
MGWILATLVALAGCSEVDGEPPIFGRLHYPVSVAVTPSGDHLLVANSNFDLGKRYASVAVVDLETRSFIEDSGVSVGAFPGALTLAPPRELDGEPRSRVGYLPIREDDSLTWFQIDWVGGDPVLRCDDPEESYADRRCAGRYVITRGEDDDGKAVSVGNDPYSSIYLPGRIGEPDHLVVGSLRTGSLDLFEISPVDGAPALTDRFVVTQGLNDLALHAPSRTIFVSAKYAAVVLRVQVETDDEGSRLVGLAPLNLPLATSSSDIGRSLAFTADGSRLLVAWRAPDSLMVFDTTSQGSVDPDVSLLGMIPMGDDPATVRIFPSGPDGADRAYIVSLSNNSLYVVDPAALNVEARVRLGPSNESPEFSGISPFALAWSPTRKEAYVANFLGHSVSVVDLDPDRDTYHTVIEEIR